MRSPVSWRTPALISVVALLVLAVRLLPVASWLETFTGWVSSLGMPGVALFVAVYVVAAVLFVPGSILTLGAGAVFGLFRGTVAASLGATLGAGAAFLVGRHVARERVARWVEANPRFAAIDGAMGREGGRIVLLARLSPVFPYNLLNYLFGLTGVGFWRYLFASWIGMLPATFLYVYLGFAGRAAAQAAAGSAPARGGKTILWGLGLAATVLLTWYLTRLARASLKGSLPDTPLVPSVQREQPVPYRFSSTPGDDGHDQQRDGDQDPRRSLTHRRAPPEP